MSAHCYAEAITLRFKRGPAFLPGVSEVKLHPERLDQPLRWRKPRRIFVCSMSDLFHEDVPDEFIDEVFAPMWLATRHTFQVLTKRPERMLKYLTGDINAPKGLFALTFPLPNVWLGVSVENQYWADRRIPLLLQTPAAVRFLSMEPLLKAVDLRNLEVYKSTHPHEPSVFLDALTGHVKGPDDMGPKVDQVIIGGESGPGHRPMEVAWAQDIADQCVAAGVPVFIKQDAGAKPGQQGRLPDDLWALKEFPSAAGA